MATIIVSATGGNWSSTATWVGGVLPAVGDDIVANATSGPLTVDSNRTCLTINFTGYTNATGFTISNGVTLTVSGTFITLGAGMTYNQTTTGVISTTYNGATNTITFAGIIIPNLTIAKPFGGSSVAISGSTPIVKNLVIAGNNIATLTGTALTVTNTITASQRIDGVVPILISGTVTLSGTGNGVLNTGFTVPTGSTLIIASNIVISGTITFAAGSSLTPGTYTVSISYGTTLDSSVVTWYNISISNATGVTVTLISDWNISNNLSYTNGSFGSFITAATVKTVTVQGSFISTNAVYNALVLTNIILNLTGQGTISFAYLRGTSSIININTANLTGYVIGSSTFTGANSMILGQNLTFNLVGTSVASAFSGTTLQLRDNTTIDTNRTSVGGSNPIYAAIAIDNSANITTEITCLGNLSFLSYASASTSAANGAKILFGGNLSTTVIADGTSTLEFTGSSAATWGAGTYRNNIVVNKSSSAVVTTASAITWGLASRTLTMNSTVNFSTNSNTFTLVGTPLTINDTFGNLFFNVSIPASTLNITGGLMRITSNLTLTSLGATFAGTSGWDCNNLICSTAGTFNITLQQAVTYRTRTGVSITGGLATTARPTMTSSGASNAIWTLDFGATQSLIYVNGIRIDSSGGQTVWSFGVLPADISTTINWNPGVPLRTVAYTFVT